MGHSLILEVLRDKCQPVWLQADSNCIAADNCRVVNQLMATLLKKSKLEIWFQLRINKQLYHDDFFHCNEWVPPGNSGIKKAIIAANIQLVTVVCPEAVTTSLNNLRCARLWLPTQACAVHIEECQAAHAAEQVKESQSRRQPASWALHWDSILPFIPPLSLSQVALFDSLQERRGIDGSDSLMSLSL